MLDPCAFINEVLQHLRSGIDLQTQPAPDLVMDGDVLFDQVAVLVEFVTSPAVAIARDPAVDMFDFDADDAVRADQHLVYFAISILVSAKQYEVVR